MAFSWKEYLLLAQAIYRSKNNFNNEEAACRTTVSRAYYAAICGARNFARDHQQFVPSYSGADHFNVREHFRRIGRNDVADKLKDLHLWRIQCDYNDIVSNVELLTQNAIKQAFQVFNHLDRILATQPRP
jgi:hypothetical protein